MTRILGVHGVGNHRPDEAADEASRRLSGIWHRHLSTVLPALAAQQVEVAYYADRLCRPGRQGGQGLEDLSDDAESMLRQWMETFGLPDASRQGWGTMPLRQALAWIAERRRLSPKLVELFVAVFFREVAAYLDPADQSARRAARARVVTTLRRHAPKVVLAHSLGSVVAYEALWCCPDVEIDLLVTLGSPLALPHAVFHRLYPAPEDGHGMRPSNVARWVNIADPGDLVALPPRGVSRRFRDVNADVHDLVHAFDFHLAGNYLKCAQLTTLLRAYI
jgi:hypothetical protein